LEEAIRLDPKYALAWYNTGVTLHQLGKYEQSLVANEEAIRLNPNYAVAWYNKGDSLHQLGRYDEASEAVDHALRISPNDEMAKQLKRLTEGKTKSASQ